MPKAVSSRGCSMLAEMKEFASFSAATQRYIRRSLDLGLCRPEPPRPAGRSGLLERWARNPAEAAAIVEQARVYRRLARIAVPEGIGLDEMEPLIAPLVTMSAFDLGQGRLGCFASYRFLYERLIGPGVRPWLAAAFCAAAMMPNIRPDRRQALLRSIDPASLVAGGWSSRRPGFNPEWVDKVDLAALA